MDRVEYCRAQPGRTHRGRVWEPSEGSHPNDEIATGLSGLYDLFMTRETIVQIWESEGIKPTGHTIVIRDDREASCFIETKGELMTVGRVSKLELRDTFIAITTAKDERFIFVYEDVLGFKLGGQGEKRDRPTAGFGR